MAYTHCFTCGIASRISHDVQIVPVMVNGEGHFLLEGRHVINQARFTVNCPIKDGRSIVYKNLTDEYIFAGTRHRIVVPRGKLGLALERGEPVIYEPGSLHLVNSPLFEYKGSVDVTNQVVTHGSLKIVIVKDGQVGITYNNGVLELLQTGRHHITAETHILAGFVSTGQQTLRISEVTIRWRPISLVGAHLYARRYQLLVVWYGTHLPHPSLGPTAHVARDPLLRSPA